MTTDGATETVELGERGGGAVLEVVEVSKDFGQVRAVEDVSFTLPVGQIRGIIGPNGAGKTTLFDVIAGVQRASRGRIVFDGSDITKLSPVKRARRGVRRTFQRQQPIGWLSVEENVLAALEWRGGGGGLAADLVASPTRRSIERERRERVAAVVETCGLDRCRDRSAAELSIGEARRLELARAVVDLPQLLLLDEPTSGLEESEVEVFASIVRALCRETDSAVLIIEHDVPFVMSLCDQIMAMDLGRLIAEGTPTEISQDPGVRAAYLGEL